MQPSCCRSGRRCTIFLPSAGWTRCPAANILSCISCCATAGPSELSRSLYASSARIAALLKHLEAKGWIVRTPDAADVRRVDVVLTEAGAACIRERLGAVLDEVSVLLSALSPEEAAEYVRLQRKLLEKGGTV